MRERKRHSPKMEEGKRGEWKGEEKKRVIETGKRNKKIEEELELQNGLSAQFDLGSHWIWVWVLSGRIKKTWIENGFEFVCVSPPLFRLGLGL